MDKTIVHFEIPAEDVDRLKTFYENLFGGKFIYAELPDMPYWMIHPAPTDEGGMPQALGINGGMYKKENDLQKPANWIQVDDIDAHTARSLEYHSPRQKYGYEFGERGHASKEARRVQPSDGKTLWEDSNDQTRICEAINPASEGKESKDHG